MLSFFRKYQKIFFIVTAFFIVVSFTFFGTYSAVQRQSDLPDRDVGKLIDGSMLKEKKLNQIKRFLQNGLEEGGRFVNLLNDSFIHRDLILSGLGELLAENYFDQLKPQLESRWKRIKNYSPYVHPNAPHVSAQAVWEQFAPEIPRLLEEAKRAPETFSKREMSLLFKLYAAQAKFPAHLLHRMIYYQQEQNQSVEPDQALPHLDMTLFGFQGVEGWFGETFIDLACQFILNAAHIAKEMGYAATKEEVRLQLLQNIYHGLKAHDPKNPPTTEDVQRYFTSQVRALGLDEDSMIEIWRGLLAFRRQFEEIGNAVFVDSLSQDHFQKFVKSACKIRRFDLPSSLQLCNFRSLLKFQRYIEAVATVNEKDLLALPESFHTPEEVAKEYPQLVQKSFDVEIASVSKQELIEKVSLKQTWDWEGEEENYAILAKEFSFLTKEDNQSCYEILENLDDRTRWKVDQYALKCIVDQNPQWLDDALSSAAREKKTLHLRLKEEEGLFSGADFLTLLETKDPRLKKYSIDQETFYSIHVLKEADSLELISFEEASSDGTLDSLLDDLLLSAYEEMDFGEAFESVKDEVGAKVYADLLSDLEIETSVELENLDDYALHRFDKYLSDMRTLVKEDGEAFKNLQKNSKWALIELEEELPNEASTLAQGEFSEIKNRSFFQLLEKTVGKATGDDLEAEKRMLSKDARMQLARDMINQIKESNAIHLE